MEAPNPHEITQLLEQVREGDTTALDRLLPLVYDELHALAHRQRASREASETLNTTALVHEAYEKLARQGGGWDDRGHFFRVAAMAMRHIMVDYARKQHAAKRGGKNHPVTIEKSDLVAEERTAEVLALDEALTRLSTLDERQGEVVQLRYFIGLTIPETADVLGLSPATIKREWTAARAWLHRAMSDAV